jgi:adenosine kinase
MKKNKNKTILVSGSLAYDRIMDFPGYFKDRILPDKIHILNVSFIINGLKENFGGTAGNIAYSLALLGEKPKILSLAGEDFKKYDKWLKKNKIDTSLIKINKESTACAYIITDKNDNQIAGFYPGSLDNQYCQIANKFAKVDLAIVAPDDQIRMKKYLKLYKEKKIPYIFDPGQNVGLFKASELKYAITGAKVVIGNDYEIEIIRKTLKIKIEKLAKMTETVIITKGSKGSEVYSQNKKFNINPAKPKKSLDPTGAGDAFRAGLIKGILSGWPIEKSARLGSVVAVYTVEKYGTQTHEFSWCLGN